jgi:transposase
MDVSYKELYSMNRQLARLRLLQTLWKTNSIAETARRWKTSRQVVRRWLRRYEEAGTEALIEHSRRPKHSPHQTSARIEQLVLQARKTTAYGRKRLDSYLWRQQALQLSAHTIRHILRRVMASGDRNVLVKSSTQPIGPGNTNTPSPSLFLDVKDILDKDTIGTERWQHLRTTQLPRYQWTFCEATTRLRFLCYSYQLKTARMVSLSFS